MAQGRNVQRMGHLGVVTGLMELVNVLAILGLPTFGQIDSAALVFWFLWTGIELLVVSLAQTKVGPKVAQSQPV